MRRSASLLLVLFVLALCGTTFAQKRTITLPPGTTVEKMGAGHFKFTLPNRQIVEVKDFNLRTRTVGFVSVLDPDPPTKPGVAANQRRIADPDPPPKPVTAAKGKKAGPTGTIKPNLPSNPVVTGKQGTLGKTKILTRAEAAKLPRTNYIEIDDEPTWLPITITFQPGK